MVEDGKPDVNGYSGLTGSPGAGFPNVGEWGPAGGGMGAPAPVHRKEKPDPAGDPVGLRGIPVLPAVRRSQSYWHCFCLKNSLFGTENCFSILSRNTSPEL